MWTQNVDPNVVRKRATIPCGPKFGCNPSVLIPMGENWVHTFGSNLGPHLGPRIWVRSRILDIPAMATDRYNEAGTDWQRQQWRSQSFELAVHEKKIIWAENNLGRSHNWDAGDGEY